MESTSVITSSDPSASRLGRAFEEAAREGRAALVVYVTAGHPAPEVGLDVLLTLADSGADVIELGVPFSDPLADGPVIQRSSHEAILRGVDLGWTLDLLRRFTAERPTPVVLFSYLNPVLGYGLERFLEDASGAGAAGVLLTDLPAGADAGIESAFARSPLDLVRLAAPTSSPARLREIGGAGGGFLYYISRTGVTGTGAALAEGLESEVEALRAATTLPVAVGFGICTPEQAAAVARYADGVVVGSALVELLAGRRGRGGRARAGPGGGDAPLTAPYHLLA
jgi:tryptophan synthase alpha chain